uniref:Uncharacterized protein n=1 Tax=Rhizophora mucronata TaxID=61149 RepID=A0A2P2PUF1_RHIMU
MGLSLNILFYFSWISANELFYFYYLLS